LLAGLTLIDIKLYQIMTRTLLFYVTALLGIVIPFHNQLNQHLTGGQVQAVKPGKPGKGVYLSGQTLDISFFI
jgi:hypothetical protein